MDMLETILNSLNKSKQNPTLQTTNGIGMALFGRYSPDFMGDLLFKIHFFCFVFIPIIPLGIYLVRVDNLNPVEGTTHSIYGKLSVLNFLSLFGFKVFPVLILTIGIEIVGKLITLIIMFGVGTAIWFGVAALFGWF